MVWGYLSEGGYLHPLFGWWYSGWGLLLFFLLGFLPGILLVAIPEFENNDLQPQAIRKDVLYRVYVFGWTLRKMLQELGRLSWRKVLVAELLVMIYMILLVVIMWLPDALVSAGSIQELSVGEFEQLISFLQRFCVFGGFLLIFALSTYSRAVIQLTLAVERT